MIKLYIALLIETGQPVSSTRKLFMSFCEKLSISAMEKGLRVREVKRVKKPRPSADEERRTRAEVGQQDERKKYRLDESLSPFPHSSLSFFPRRTMRGKVCDRRKKWTAAIMEFRATRVVLLPPPQRSLVQRQLC